MHIQRSKRSPRIQISPVEVVVPDDNVGYPDVPDDNVGNPDVLDDNVGYPDVPDDNVGYPDVPDDNVSYTDVPDGNVVGPGKVEDVQMAMVVDLMNLMAMLDISIYLMAMLLVLTR